MESSRERHKVELTRQRTIEELMIESDLSSPDSDGIEESSASPINDFDRRSESQQHRSSASLPFDGMSSDQLAIELEDMKTKLRQIEQKTERFV